MSEGYSRSIFAYELADVLAKYGHTIESLQRKPFSFDQDKVERLASSQRSQGSFPGLNLGELMSIVIELNLSQADYLRLCAALTALGAQRQMRTYLTEKRAWDIACEVRDAALVWWRQHKDDADLWRRRWSRGLGVDADSTSQPRAAASNQILVQAIDTYDEGEVLATLGMLAAESAWGREQLEHAIVLLERAQSLLAKVPTMNGEHQLSWQYWNDEIRHALQSVRDELR